MIDYECTVPPSNEQYWLAMNAQFHQVMNSIDWLCNFKSWLTTYFTTTTFFLNMWIVSQNFNFHSNNLFKGILTRKALVASLLKDDSCQRQVYFKLTQLIPEVCFPNFTVGWTSGKIAIARCGSSELKFILLYIQVSWIVKKL